MKPITGFSRGDPAPGIKKKNQSADLAATGFSDDDLGFDGLDSDDDGALDVESLVDFDESVDDAVLPLAVSDDDESDSVPDGLLLA